MRVVVVGLFVSSIALLVSVPAIESRHVALATVATPLLKMSVAGVADNIPAMPSSTDSPSAVPELALTAAEVGQSGSYRLIYNTWGAPRDEKLVLRTFTNPGGSAGWEWERKNSLVRPQDGFVQPIYPNARVGGCPWEKSNVPQFPIAAKDVKSLKFSVAYKFLNAPTGTWNLSYDFFFTDSPNFGPDPNVKAEVMIWLDATWGLPSDQLRGTYSDGTHIFDLYSRTMAKNRLYYAFRLKDAPADKAIDIDAGKLLSQLPIDPSWYLHGIEFGNEVLNGSGATQINKLVVTLNGSGI